MALFFTSTVNVNDKYYAGELPASVLTFELSNSAEQDVLLRLLVLQRLQDTLNDGLCKLRLLRLFGLLFVTDPRVQNLFEFSCHYNLLTLDEDFALKLGGFLRA